ncbi:MULTISPECIES: glycosyltransferase family 4 protein [unclassified Serratia (in: enterobacteria)]|uniref:glycosyltransferase family 4 protein n=1 Tax=unclassified Serratia (in: enterobacteria) TaxID=2647522 RepID=UPI002ED0C336|nr:glycosyltransferase family 1 protein [Serratia sp. C2(2)]MEE4447378.1 glycosyltransferase family 1 protein [Serratia sp. C2(1)]
MIYVNARFLTQDVTGVQRFAQQICLALNALRTDVVFLSPKNIKHHDVAELLNVKIIGSSSGHRWEQKDLPAYLATQGKPLLLNLGNTAPIFYQNKIVTHHDVTYKRYPQSYSWKFRLLYNVFVPLMLRNSKMLLTVSEFSKKELHEAYGYPLDDIHVIYNAAGSIFCPKKNEALARDPYLLAVSSPNYHKNFHGLITAFNQWENRDKVKLKIIGAANANFNNVTPSLAATENVEFTGRVSDEQLIELYSNALAFVFPSFYEGFGIPPLEAQACGCPVISSNSASLPEVLGDSALYFSPDNTNDIAACISRITSDDALRQQLIQSGFNNIKRFSWTLSASKINELIDAHQ